MLSDFKFLAYFVKKYDAYDAASGVRADRAAYYRLHKLGRMHSIEQKLFCIGEGIRVFAVADAHYGGRRIGDMLLDIFYEGFQRLLTPADSPGHLQASVLVNDEDGLHIQQFSGGPFKFGKPPALDEIFQGAHRKNVVDMLHEKAGGADELFLVRTRLLQKEQLIDDEPEPDGGGF